MLVVAVNNQLPCTQLRVKMELVTYNRAPMMEGATSKDKGKFADGPGSYHSNRERNLSEAQSSIPVGDARDSSR